MREYAKKPENQSRTLDSNPRASRQAPISDILQAYKNGTLGKQPIQRESVEDEELLQTKRSGQAPVNVILQRYKESIQRNAPEEDEELPQGKFDTAQRTEIGIDEEKLLQGKFESDIQTEQEPIQREEKSNNTGLPNNLKTGAENLSGYSMDNVKVHYNSDKPAQLNALAYTQGTDIHVASGQEKHLPHEVWHVVQQKQGRVQPTMQLQGVNVNDNEGLEKEADIMGRRVKNQTIPSNNSTPQNDILTTKSIQMINDFEGILEDKKGRKKEHHVLVYGTEDARIQQRGQDENSAKKIPKVEAVSTKLPEGFKQKKTEQPSGWATTGFYTADRYNNYSWRDFPKNLAIKDVYEKPITPYFSIFNPCYLKSNPTDNTIKQDIERFKDAQSLCKEDKDEVGKYQEQLLAHPNYSPIKTLRESDDFVTTKESVGEQSIDTQKGDPENVTKEEKEVAKSRFELQTRRACKFGLEYMSKKEKTRGEMGEIAFLSSVHGAQAGKTGASGGEKQEPTDSRFILEKIRTGDRPGGGKSSARVPITTSEQRKLFRIRSGNIGIRFYNSKGKLIKAPWNRSGGDFDKKGWQDYELKRRKKYEALAEKLGISKEGTLIDLKGKVVKGLEKRYPDKSLSESVFIERIKAISYYLWENLCKISSDTIWFVSESICASILTCSNDDELKKQIAYFISTMNLGYTEEENYRFGLLLYENKEIKSGREQKNLTKEQVAYYLEKIVKRKGKQDEFWTVAKKIYSLIQDSKDIEELKKQIAFEISMLYGRQHQEKQNYEYANQLLENKETQALIPLITHRMK